MKEIAYVPPEGSFVQFPIKWVFDLSGDDLKRLMLVWWRFKYFADMAFAEGRPINRCYFESQEKMCLLFGMSTNSRTKVGAFLKRMEKGEYISIHKEKIIIDGKPKPRHYLVVKDESLLRKYNIETKRRES